MTRLTTTLTTLAILTAGLAALPMGAAQADTAPIGFGMEASAINVQAANGVPADYGTFWIGPWTLTSGWGGPDNQLTNMKNAGVTPAIHHYYWGDDISPSCVENGCYSSLHNTQKDRAGWNQLTDELIDHLNAKMGGAEVVIFLESEFNKGGIETYEPFDGYMADMADRIHAGYPNAKVVLGFGSWGTQHYQNFDRAAAASDYIGIQGMRGSTRDSASHYQDLTETTINNARFVHDMFGKPVFIQDLALSSYPEPQYLDMQATELQEMFDNLDQLKAVGVMAIVYRSWNDSPGMDLANYYGQAERHWGLSWSGTSDLKPAGDVWVAGVQAERASPAGAASSVESSFSVSFTVAGGSNEWWVETGAQGTAPIASVEASINGGEFTMLPKTSWGAYAKSFHAPKGHAVFRATSTAGDVYTADPVSWLGGSVPAQPGPAPEPTPEPAPEPTPEPTPEPAPAYSADYTFGDVNEWWVDVYAHSGASVASVEVSINDGAFTALPASSWGSFAKSFHAPAGHIVVRSTSAAGDVHTSQPMSWLGGGAPADSQPEPAPAPAPEPVNTAPVADLAISAAPLRISADASGSSDADGDALRHTIDFGDGTIVEAATASHDYASAGSYTVTVTVSDGEASSTASQTVTVEAPALTGSITPIAVGNEYWLEARIDASTEIVGVSFSIDGGAHQVLPANSWGTYSKSVHVAPGAMVTFRATDVHGQRLDSEPVAWGDAPVAFDAAFTGKTIGNKWWVEVEVSGNEGIATVEARVNGGAWITLDETQWDSYAKRIKVGNNGDVQFRATSIDGDRVLSDVIAWS